MCVLVIPGDVALQPARTRPVPTRASLLLPAPTVVPPPAAIRQLAALLNASKRVTLLCGGGCEGAHDELLQLAGALQAPIVHALRGKEHVEWDNPFDVGMTGLIGFSSGYYAMGACDALLMLGTDFPYQQFYPKGVGSRRWTSGRGDRAAHPDRAGPGRRRPRHAAGAAAAHRGRPRRQAPADVRRALPGRPQGAGRAGAARHRAARCTRSTSPAPSTRSRPTTPCSPATWACRRCGRRATCG